MGGDSPDLSQAQNHQSWRVLLSRIVYELGLVLALLVFALAALHGSVTRHFNVESISRDQFRIPSAGWSPRVGEELPVYRFNPDARSEIARARVDALEGASVKLSYVPAFVTAPMARQGTITEATTDSVTVNVGSALGLTQGDQLVAFDGREPVGRISLSDVGPSTSSGQILLGSGVLRPGMTISEFTVATQVAVFDSPSVAWLEMVLLILVPLGYGSAWFWLRESPLLVGGERLMRAVRERASDAVKLAVGGLAAIPFVWIGVRFLTGLLAYLGERLATTLLPEDARPQAIAATSFLDRNVLPVAVLVGIAYAYVLLTSRKSPILFLWRRISFKGGPLTWTPSSNSYWLGLSVGVALVALGIYRADRAMFILGAVLVGALVAAPHAKNVAIWLLHLLIFYAFAWTLLSFMAADMNAALATAWPGAGIGIHGGLNLQEPTQLLDFFSTFAAAFAHMVTHAPRVASLEAGYALLRYVLWTLTIVGCLVGYGHSILGYIWGKRIRNLDFTLPGWITNAVCYGPLLGVVVWQFMGWPALRGQDPIVTSGPIASAYLAVELFLDVVYMLTIWNLGVMFGVMTDKGVRTTGFYAVVRHPSYTMEALMFVALELKALSTGMHWLAASLFLITYWIRSEREDDFMTKSNPAFAQYREQTPYKFIPGFY